MFSLNKIYFINAALCQISFVDFEWIENLRIILCADYIAF